MNNRRVSFSTVRFIRDMHRPALSWLVVSTGVDNPASSGHYQTFSPGCWHESISSQLRSSKPKYLALTFFPQTRISNHDTVIGRQKTKYKKISASFFESWFCTSRFMAESPHQTKNLKSNGCRFSKTAMRRSNNN